MTTSLPLAEQASAYEAPTGHANAPAQEGEDEPELPRAAAPDLHREGAAKKEKPTNTPPEPIADVLTLPVASPSASAASRTQRAPKRRRRDPDNPLPKKVGFRCTEAQKTRIEQLAAAAELNVAAYLERRALADDSTGITTRDECLERAIMALDAARGQLAPVGNNANQIAYRLNAGIGVEPGPAAAVLDRALALVAEVRMAVAEVDASAMRLAKAKRR
ncbi:plasmid mobilization protein [Kitasatospora sp. NPDC059327]|uniref:plasmid mobilization protein n=1 Tax=Kitasatospora sp. NPDC059327 TaxID=3346803 RepID=UPI0036930CF6